MLPGCFRPRILTAGSHLVGDVGVDLGHGEELLDAGNVALLGGAEQRRDDKVLILSDNTGGRDGQKTCLREGRYWYMTESGDACP